MRTCAWPGCDAAAPGPCPYCARWFCHVHLVDCILAHDLEGPPSSSEG